MYNRLGEIAATALDSIHTFHTLGFTHCDVKLENLINDGKNIRLIDFGESYRHDLIEQIQ